MPPDNSREDMELTFRELVPEETGREVVVATPETQPAQKETSVAVREPDGRFAPKTPAQDTGQDDSGAVVESKPKGAAGTVAHATPAPAVSKQAPVSWKPEEREQWASMKPEAQSAVIRREREVDAALRTSAEARRFHDEFVKTVQPYEAMIRAENSTPLRAVNELFMTAAALRTAPPGMKAALVADMIMEFGIDLPTLDRTLLARLQGAPAPGHTTDPILEAVDQRLKPVMDFFTQIQGAQQGSIQQLETEVSTTWDEFATNPEYEFANDLKEDIADILELAGRRKQVVSLQDAYKRATLAHPTISKILADRQQANGATQQTAAARRALAAAVSLPSNGGAPSRDGEEEGDGSIRSDILSSVRQVSNRR